ncbi:MAG: ferredoxin--NADP+ reductase [Alphaproteobacteria bacterium]|jgi:ferredoxin--NADP+ reductase
MAMAKWLHARVIERIDWNAHLFSLKFTCSEHLTFTAGQFVKIGLEESNGQVLSRPYSLVNEPSTKHLEIIAVPVAKGSLSPQLQMLNKGDTLKVMSPATGFLTINEVPASENLFMLATGTGVGPFLSIIQNKDVWQQYLHVVLVYGARKVEDLAYLPTIQKLEREYPSQFTFVPITSRETYSKGLHGRIPSLIQQNAIQQKCGIQITPEHSQVMLCGNPDMIKDANEVLNELGLKKHLRRSPGQISVERYW